MQCCEGYNALLETDFNMSSLPMDELGYSPSTGDSPTNIHMAGPATCENVSSPESATVNIAMLATAVAAEAICKEVNRNPALRRTLSKTSGKSTTSGTMTSGPRTPTKSFTKVRSNFDVKETTATRTDSRGRNAIQDLKEKKKVLNHLRGPSEGAVAKTKPGRPLSLGPHTQVWDISTSRSASSLSSFTSNGIGNGGGG